VPLITPAYHVGLVVEHIEDAQEELERVLGVSWGRVQRKTLRLETLGGPKDVDVAYVYTLEGPPYLEVIEQRVGTVFEPLGLHHLGLWTDDSAGESARFEHEGCPRESVILKPDGSWSGGLFHGTRSGLRLELVDIDRSGPRLARYLAGGDYT
jgi:hypothetical protein